MPYDVNFAYSAKEWDTIENIDEPSADDAEEFALKEIERLYPEAFDIEITEIIDRG